MFLGISWRAQHVFFVPYQWRRIVTLLSVGAALSVAGGVFSIPTPLALVLAIAYPLVLFVFGFYLAPERRQMAALARRALRLQHS
jgi:uncharacterized membrane protein